MAMPDFLTALLLAAAHVPLSLLLNRLTLKLRPQKRDLPAQGTFFKSALLALLLLGSLCPFLLGEGPRERFLWSLYVVVLLGCQCLVFISVMCVSESGRRFFLLVRIAANPGVGLEALKASYRGDDMLTIRRERLVHWGVMEARAGRLVLKKRSAYLYSLFFYLWGRLLGFRWFAGKGKGRLL